MILDGLATFWTVCFVIISIIDSKSPYTEFGEQVFMDCVKAIGGAVIIWRIWA